MKVTRKGGTIRTYPINLLCPLELNVSNHFPSVPLTGKDVNPELAPIKIANFDAGEYVKTVGFGVSIMLCR